MIFYIIAANMSAGMIFGWIYWKRGLEAAMISHVLAHVFLLFAEYTIGLLQ